MAPRRGFTVLVATDGSPEARAAVQTTVAFPWPRRTRVAGIVARTPAMAAPDWSERVWVALEAGRQEVARDARRLLRQRWPDAHVGVVSQPALEGILTEARRVRASAITIGSRGHGPIGRLLLGSVSRGVVRRATCSVLVVRRRPRAIRRFVLAVDGSANARRAVSFLARLTPVRGGQVTLIRVVEPLRPPSAGPLPGGVRAALARQVRAINAAAIARARRDVAAAARELRRVGWRTREIVRVGAPLPEILATSANTHCLVVGARGVGGLERLLLGSIAEGVVNRARAPVLVVR